ncbi:MAG TPA: PAS domain S-box protein [Candidatus Acidoferrum sp.]
MRANETEMAQRTELCKRADFGRTKIERVLEGPVDDGLNANQRWKQVGLAYLSMQRGAPMILLLAVGVFVSLLVQPAIPHAYTVVLLLATAACGWIGRETLGAIAGTLASVGTAYFFLSPAENFHLNANSYPEAALFTVAAIGVGWLSGNWRSKQDGLQESREQFRILLDGVKDYAVILLDHKGRIATWNAGAQRIKGYTAEEILGRSTDIFYSAEEIRQGKPRELLTDAADRGSVRTEGWRTRKDGTRFWAEVTITALFKESGAIRGYAKTTRDVTDLKKSQEALEVKEEELRVVVESAPDGVLMTDDRGTIMFVNGRAESMFGYRREELIGRKVEMLVPAKNRGAHIGRRTGYQQEPHTRPMGMGLDLKGLKKDGMEFPVEISLSPVESGKERRFIASVRDISERLSMERELQNTKIQDLAQILIRDLDGRIVRWNTGMERMYGYSHQEAEGAISHELLKTKFPELLGNIEAELLRTGYWEGELAHVTKAGNKIIATSNWVLHRDKEGKPWRVLESSTDVTALKEAEKKTRELNRALEEQNADLALAKALIEAQTQKIAMTAKMSALGEMAGGMAHEINNPMGIIHARASDLMEVAAEKDTVASATVLETMEKIRSTASRVTKITMGLRKFARETRDDPATEIGVREILDETLPFCLERLKQNSVELRVAPMEKSLRIDCRPTEISQVLLNLLNNAVDAVQPLAEKWVELQVRSAGKDVEISVMDSGKGIPEKIRDKVGQPFFTTKVVGHGTGLGLSISRGIVEAHGGHLNLDTQCEHTRFVVTLPKAVAREQATVEVGR